MNHYFINDPNDKNDYRVISFVFDDIPISLTTDRNVFSNRRLDDGTLALIKVLKKANLEGTFLDLGAGYGPIGLTLKLVNKSLKVTLSDINERCVYLIYINKDNLNLDVNVIHSDSFSNIQEKFDTVSLNSPISCGKSVCFKMYQDVKEHLNDGGSFYLVIRKDKGALSHMKYLSSLFSEVNVIYKEKGYYCIKAK